VDPGTLEPLEAARAGAVLALAALCGRTRLIDNAVLDQPGA
jgi:pantothenate synthetase